MEAVKTTQEKRVICYQCSMACKASKVYPEYTARDKKESLVYYDEEGRYHDHSLSSSVNATKYRCSEGHEWSEASKVECWCGWKHDQKVS